MKLNFERLRLGEHSAVLPVLPVCEPRIAGLTPRFRQATPAVDGVSAIGTSGGAQHLASVGAQHRQASNDAGFTPETLETPVTQSQSDLVALEEFDRTDWCAAECRHYRRRPPDGEGYCCGRSDLAPAFGDSHPLRHLPTDRGASCDTFEREDMPIA